MSAKQDPQDREVKEIMRHILYIEDVLKAQSSRKAAEKIGIDRAALSRHIKEVESISEKQFFERVDGKGLVLTDDGREFKRISEKLFSATHELLAYILRGKFLNRHKNCIPFTLPHHNPLSIQPIVKHDPCPDVIAVCESCMVHFHVPLEWKDNKVPLQIPTIKGYAVLPSIQPWRKIPFDYSGYEFTSDFRFWSLRVSYPASAPHESFSDWLRNIHDPYIDERMMNIYGNNPPSI